MVFLVPPREKTNKNFGPCSLPSFPFLLHFLFPSCNNRIQTFGFVHSKQVFWHWITVESVKNSFSKIPLVFVFVYAILFSSLSWLYSFFFCFLSEWWCEGWTLPYLCTYSTTDVQPHTHFFLLNNLLQHTSNIVWSVKVPDNYLESSLIGQAYGAHL